MLMPVMNVRPMNVGMNNGLVNMVVLVWFCGTDIRMLMLMMFVVDMRMTMGEHRMRMKMAVHFAIEEEYSRKHA